MASKQQLNPSKSASRHLPQPKKIASSRSDKTAPPQKIAYSIAHTIPGRIRFRIPRLAKDSEYADKLKLAIESDPRTTNVRINPTAASIVINYQVGIADRQMRSHLVNLIQTAPQIVLPTPVTARSILGTIFDAVINLIDSTRKINQARNAIVHKRFRTDIWERLLSGTKTVIKGLRSTMMFILPHKRSPEASNQAVLEPMSFDKSVVST